MLPAFLAALMDRCIHRARCVSAPEGCSHEPFAVLVPTDDDYRFCPIFTGRPMRGGACAAGLCVPPLQGEVLTVSTS